MTWALLPLTPDNARLANISTRGFVDTGDNVIIGGFIIRPQAPATSTRVVIRAIGPSLTQFGIPNALADPTLELRDGNGASLVANDDWQDDPAQAAELTAANLAPTNPLESGIAATLPLGPYTAIVRGKDNTTGVALVEVYALPDMRRPCIQSASDARNRLTAIKSFGQPGQKRSLVIPSSMVCSDTYALARLSGSG